MPTCGQLCINYVNSMLRSRPRGGGAAPPADLLSTPRAPVPPLDAGVACYFHFRPQPQRVLLHNSERSGCSVAGKPALHTILKNAQQLGAAGVRLSCTARSHSKLAALSPTLMVFLHAWHVARPDLQVCRWKGGPAGGVTSLRRDGALLAPCQAHFAYSKW